MFTEMNLQMASLSTGVQIWVNWMMLIFLGSVFFLKNHQEARYTLGAFILTMLLAMIIFAWTKNIHLFAISHLVFWVPLLLFLQKKWWANSSGKYHGWTPFKISTSFLNTYSKMTSDGASSY